MDMARRRVDLRLDEDFMARVDAEAERLGQTRTKFIERALEKALGDSSTAEQPRRREPNSRVAGSTPARSASSRASAENLSREAQGVRNVLDTTLDGMEGRQAARKKAAKPPADEVPRIAPRHWST